MARSKFAQQFERAYGDVPLPAVYRDFILSDSYVPYRQSVIRGLKTYGSTDVEIRLDDPVLLKRGELFDESDIERGDASEYHPIATLTRSPQFLAIDVTVDTAPVFLWHHETGAFHPQFATFLGFVGSLQTPEMAQRDRAKIRQTFADIRAVCKPAVARARKHFTAGELDQAAAELDAALTDRRPILYDGRNDFKAIGILCDCFNLRGRVFLAQGLLQSARAAFLDAIGCGGPPYWEAAVDAVATSCLLKDIQPALEELRDLRTEDFPVSPATILARNFDQQQIAQIRVFAASAAVRDASSPLAREILGWTQPASTSES
jgi:hypothetical protein